MTDPRISFSRSFRVLLIASTALATLTPAALARAGISQDYDPVYGGALSTATRDNGTVSLARDPFGQKIVDINNGDISLQYDPSDRRGIRSSGTDGEQVYQYAGSGLYPLYTESPDTDTKTYYIPGIQALSFSTVSPDTAVQTLVSDHSGSTYGLLDGTQAVMARYAYDTTGAISENLDCTSSQFACDAVDDFSYLYQGHEYDEEVGLHNFSARLYTPDTARFLHLDSAGQAIGYVALGNNWPNMVDPNGAVYFASAADFVKHVRLVQDYIKMTPMSGYDPVFTPPLAYKHGAIESILRNTKPEIIERNLQYISKTYADAKPGPGTASFYRHAGTDKWGKLSSLIHTSIEVQVGKYAKHSNNREDHRILNGVKMNGADELRKTKKYVDYGYAYPGYMTIIESWEKPNAKYKGMPTPSRRYSDLAAFHGYKLKDGLTALLFMELAEDGSYGWYSFEHANCAVYCLHTLDLGENPLGNLYRMLWRKADRQGIFLTRVIDNYNYRAINGLTTSDSLRLEYTAQARKNWLSILFNDTDRFGKGFTRFPYSNGNKPWVDQQVPWHQQLPIMPKNYNKKILPDERFRTPEATDYSPIRSKL